MSPAGIPTMPNFSSSLCNVLQPLCSSFALNPETQFLREFEKYDSEKKTHFQYQTGEDK